MGMHAGRRLNIESPRPHGPSYSAREGVGPNAGALDGEAARRRIFTVLDRFTSLGFIAEAEGKECPDGDSLGSFGVDPNAYFAFAIDRDDVWPYRAHGGPYESLDVLCDVLEVLHGVVSKPLRAFYQDYGGCGDHYLDFDRVEGQRALRECVNPVLARCNPPLRMEATGQIVELGEEGLEDLIGRDLPDAASPDVETRVDSAVQVFRDRHRDGSALRHAVLDLAAALEELRPRLKKEMLRKDEGALFELANGFPIRHANRKQRRDYDKPVWLRWAFYVYLATIHAVLAVEARETAHVCRSRGGKMPPSSETRLSRAPRGRTTGSGDAPSEHDPRSSRS